MIWMRRGDKDFERPLHQGTIYECQRNTWKDAQTLLVSGNAN